MASPVAALGSSSCILPRAMRNLHSFFNTFDPVGYSSASRYLDVLLNKASTGSKASI